jgi:hypothetical protein
LHQFGRRQLRWRCYQHMDVIRSDRSPDDTYFLSLADLPDQIAGTLRHLPPQHFVAILGDPYQVILYLPNRVPTCAILGHLLVIVAGGSKLTA